MNERSRKVFEQSLLIGGIISIFPSFSMFKSAILVIQVFLLAPFLALINLSFDCFSAVLFSDVGTGYAMSPATFSTLCCLSRSSSHYGL